MARPPLAPHAETHPAGLRHPFSAHSWLFGFFLHVVTGVLAVAAHYSLMWVLTLGGVAPVPASAVGFVAGAATRYLLSYYKVFTPTGSVPATLVRFAIALTAQLAANTAMLAGFLSLGWPVWVAQVTTTVLLTFVNYVVYRLWVFH